MASIDNSTTVNTTTTTDTNQTNHLDHLPWSFPETTCTSTTQSILCCHPIARLRFFGICCPFLETPSDTNARVAAYTLQSYPIMWYRKKLIKEAARDVKGAVRDANEKGTVNSGVTNGVNGFIDGLVNNVDRFFNGDGKDGGGEGRTIPLVYVGVSATLSIIDTAEYGPAIQIALVETTKKMNTKRQSATGKINNDAITQNANNHNEDNYAIYKIPNKTIPLSSISSVSAGWSLVNDPTAGGIKLFGTPPEGSGGFLQNITGGEELLRFDTMGGGGDNFFQPHRVGVRPNEYVDDVLECLRSIVEWNKERLERVEKKNREREKRKGRIGESSDYVSMS